MNTEQIYKKVLAHVEKVKPYVVEMVNALKRYDSNPCIQTGVKRQDARTRLAEIVHFTNFNIWQEWVSIYSEILSEDEMEKLVQRAVDCVSFDGLDENECWKGLFSEGKNDEYLV